MDILEELEEIALLAGGGSEVFKRASGISDYLLRLVERTKRDRNESAEHLAASELSRTELIKQNSALAAENERLDALWAEFVLKYIDEQKRADSLEAVIKAAQEQRPTSYILRSNGEEYAVNLSCDPKVYLDGRDNIQIIPQYTNPFPDQRPTDPRSLDMSFILDCLITYKCDLYFDGAEGLRKKVDEQIRLLSDSHTVPAQSPQTRSSLPDNVTRVVDASTGRVKQSVTAVAVPDEVKTILGRISKWHGEFPEAPPYHGQPQSYGAAYGSNGERDYMRSLADKALQMLAAQSHDRCPPHEIHAAYGVQDTGVVDHE